MSADRQEDRIRDAADDMRSDAREMEQQSDELGEHIEEAKSVAARRQDAPEQARPADESVAPPEGTEDVAGDWRGESSGSQQGEDAEDAEGEQRGAGERGQAEPADDDDDDDGGSEPRGDAEDPAGEWRQE